MCQNHMITTHHGYLSTPNYPDANYTANQHCRCRLQTKDKGILLQVCSRLSLVGYLWQVILSYNLMLADDKHDTTCADLWQNSVILLI